MPVDLEVEVGIPFDYAHFRSVGGKGKILATDGTREGYTLTVVLTENKRHYPYNNPDWQQAAAHYAREHVYGALTAGLSAEQRAFVSVSAIATSAVKPLNLLVRQQSAKGLHAHLLVKGVAFMEPPGAMDNTVPAPARPIPLNAHILDGGLSADGLTPSASIGRIKIRFGPGGDCRVKNDIWYPPAHVAEEREAVTTCGAG